MTTLGRQLFRLLPDNIRPILRSLPIVVPLLVLFISCNEYETGESLAKRHCATCHLYPDPALLAKKTWQRGVLPEMAFRMGLDISKFQGMDAYEVHEIMQAMPSAPLVTDDEWQAIRDYYVATSPDSLPANNAAVPSSLDQFHVSTVRLDIAGGDMLTLIRKDPFNGQVYTGTRAGKLYRLTSDFLPLDSIALSSAPSDILFRPSVQPLLTRMGIMDPNDQPAGSVIQLTGGESEISVLIDSLKRPVDIKQADLNNDGQQDLVIAAFGNFTGGLYVYQKQGSDYIPHAIHGFPGTRKTIIRDMNNDGLPDILALLSQGDERIALFTNRGNFRFAYRVLLKFPAVYGSSYFELCDVNGDQHDDILYTNGDNADFSTILKPYHGIRIFQNDGKNQFSESWFFPMYGASMARALDFDEDGDPDIAAISFFPDFEKAPQRAFIYLENTDGTFKPFETPLAASSRWITMETADIDNDRDMDIILAALAFPTAVPDSLYQRWQKSGTSLLVLKNNLRDAPATVSSRVH